MKYKKLRMENFLDRLRMFCPRMDNFRLFLEDYNERLRMLLPQKLSQETVQLGHLRIRMYQAWSHTDLQQKRLILKSCWKDMAANVQQRISTSRQLLQAEFFLLDSLSPFAVLRRGYSITVRAATKEVIRNAAQVCTDEEIEINLGEGRLLGQVKKTFLTN